MRGLVGVGATLAVSIIAAALAAGSPAASTSCRVESAWGAPKPGFEERVLELVNRHRARLGRRPLVLDPTLARAARWKSLHMARFRYFAHEDTPLGRSVGARLAACGYPAGRRGWGENIAWGYPTPAAVMRGWVASPGHRANIESASFRRIGIGVARSSGGTLLWTQDFGT